MNESVTALSVTPASARSVTVPGLVDVGFVTVNSAVPCTPSLVAVIVAEPASTPDTNPVALTVPTPLLLDAHVTVRPVKTFPAESLVVAASCTVPPAATLAEAGLMLTHATGTLGGGGAGGGAGSLAILPDATMRSSTHMV